MNTTKKIFTRVFLIGEVCAFLFFYITGHQGLKTIMRLKSENIQLAHTMIEAQNEIKNIKSEIQAWHRHPWHAEKIAREELQLAHPGEEIFLINEH